MVADADEVAESSLLIFLGKLGPLFAALLSLLLSQQHPGAQAGEQPLSSFHVCWFVFAYELHALADREPIGCPSHSCDLPPEANGPRISRERAATHSMDRSIPHGNLTNWLSTTHAVYHQSYARAFRATLSAPPVGQAPF